MEEFNILTFDYEKRKTEPDYIKKKKKADIQFKNEQELTNLYINKKLKNITKENIYSLSTKIRFKNPLLQPLLMRLYYIKFRILQIPNIIKSSIIKFEFYLYSLKIFIDLYKKSIVFRKIGFKFDFYNLTISYKNLLIRKLEYYDFLVEMSNVTVDWFYTDDLIEFLKDKYKNDIRKYKIRSIIN